MAINPSPILFLKLANSFFPDYLHSMSKVVVQDPAILGGEPVFKGTRVPVKSLFDHLKGGDSIGEFLVGFPSVTREQVIALLEESKAHAQGLS